MDDVRFSITELADQLGVHFNTVRKWEKEFDIVVPRSQNANRSRYYTEKEIDIFTKIKELREENMSIDNIKRYLNRDLGFIEQEESAIAALPLSEVSTIDIKNLIADIIVEREELLKEEFKKQIQEELEKQKDTIIEQVTQKQLEQIQAENNKLINYIEKTRQEESKKSIWDRLFKKQA